MSEEDAFLDGIAADRADRTRLLVFADWLADRGDPREEFVRLHAKLLDMDGTEPEFAERNEVWNIWVREEYKVRTDRPWLGDRWLDAMCRVCTTADVEEYAENGHIFEEGKQGEVIEFGPEDHIDFGSEAYLILYHGRAGDFASPFEFVAQTVLADHPRNEFIIRGLPALDGCYPVTRGQFWRRWLEYLLKLREPPSLPEPTLSNLFLGAQYIVGGPDSHAFVAIHRDDYFALLWLTTA